MFPGTSKLHSLMRANDWTTSPLGRPEGWPRELRTVVNLMLNSKFPMFVAWGPELAFVYNDAYTEFLGGKHPGALGRRFEDIWSEIWSDIHPLVQTALAGEAIYVEDMPLVILRGGRNEQTWFTFSYSPVLDHSESVAGMFCAVTETTARVWGERRQAFQIAMADRLRGLDDPHAIACGASELLGRQLQASGVAFGEVDMAHSRIIFLPNYTDGTVQELTGSLDAGSFGESHPDLARGRTAVREDIGSDSRMGSSGTPAGYAAMNIRSSIEVPIVRDGLLRGVLIVNQSAPRQWAPQEIALAEDAAERIWNAVERARGEAALRESEASLRRLTLTLESDVAQRTRERDRIWRNSMDLLLVMGPDGFLHAVNPAWTTILGYQPDDLIGHYLEPFVHPEDVGATVDAIAQASQGPLDHLEMRLKHRDGSYRWIDWRAAPDQGMVYANGRDITIEKRQAEQLLETSEARLNVALQAGEMGAWEWDAATNTVSWLQGAAAVHGLRNLHESAAFSLRDYFRRFVHPDDRKAVAAAIALVPKEGTNRRVEYRIVWPDGTVHWIEARGQMFFDERGRPSRMVGVSINVTRRKRAEQDLKFLAEASAELAGLVDPASEPACLSCRSLVRGLVRDRFAAGRWHARTDGGCACGAGQGTTWA